MEKTKTTKTPKKDKTTKAPSGPRRSRPKPY